MLPAPTITKRRRKRRLKSGRRVVQTRFVVNTRDESTGLRKQFFFTSFSEAVAKRHELVRPVDQSVHARSDMTIAEAVGYWLENRKGEVKNVTWRDYQYATAAYIVGPLLVGTRQQRAAFTMGGRKVASSPVLEMLGPTDRTAHNRPYPCVAQDRRRAGKQSHRELGEEVLESDTGVGRRRLCSTSSCPSEQPGPRSSKAQEGDTHP